MAQNLDLQKVVIEPVVGIIKTDKLFPMIDKVYFYIPEMEDVKGKKVSIYLVEKDTATTKVVAPILSLLANANLMKYVSVIHSGKQADFDKEDFDTEKYMTSNVLYVFENNVSYVDDANAAIDEFMKIYETNAYNSIVTAGQIALRKTLIAACVSAGLKEETEVLMVPDYMTIVEWLRVGLNIEAEYGVAMADNHKNLTSIVNLDLVSIPVAALVIQMLAKAITMTKALMDRITADDFDEGKIIEL